MGRDKEGMGSIGSIIHGGANRLPASQVAPTVNVLSDQYRSVPALTHTCFYLFCKGVCFDGASLRVEAGDLFK